MFQEVQRSGGPRFRSEASGNRGGSPIQARGTSTLRKLSPSFVAKRVEEATDGPSGDAVRRGKRHAQVAEVLGRLGEGLSSEEYALLKAVYVDGQSMADLARLRGVAGFKVRSRVREIVTRMMSREFGFVVRSRRLSHPRAWTLTRRNVGEACFLRGLSCKQAALALNMTLYSVRRHRECIVALCESEAR